MKSVPTIALGALALALLAPAGAWAQTAPLPPEGAGPPPSAQGVGRAITRDEASAAYDRLFDRLDLNHDGRLDAADRGLQAQAAFDHLDANHDGFVTKDEVNAMIAERMAHRRPGAPAPDPARIQRIVDMMFQRMDADHDGRISKGEWIAVTQRATAHGPMMGAWDPAMRQAGSIIAAADPTHSGVVTRQAFHNAAMAEFDAMDANHDGIVTAEERSAYRAAHRPHDGRAWRGHGDAGDGGPPPPPPGGDMPNG